MKKTKVKALATLILITSFFLPYPSTAGALTYSEIIKYQSGQVLGTTTSASISLVPEPTQTCDTSTPFRVNVTANAPVDYDVRVGSPGGTLFARQSANVQTSQATGTWVTNGMSFFLTDTAQGTVLATANANLSSQNCPNFLNADPNPIQTCSGSLGTTTISAKAGIDYEVRIGSPDGTLFSQQTANVSTLKATGNWVTDGMKFYLVSKGTQTVLNTLTINLTTSGCAASITLDSGTAKPCSDNSSIKKVSAWAPVDYEVRLNSPTGDLFSKQSANQQLQQTTGNWVTDGMKFYVTDSKTKATLASAVATISSKGCELGNPSSPINNIRSTTWYEFGPTYAQTQLNLQQQIPRIKQAGFNTIWLVTPWIEINPQPLTSPPVYNEGSIVALKQTLEVLKNNNMQAIIGLNYLGNGWAPTGIDYCSWATNQTQYQAFVNYASEFMRRFEAYSNLAHLLVFTENAEPCNLNPFSNAQQIASMLQLTLGNFPNQLPSTLRSKFKIGYHDYDLINLGWAQGNTPIANPNSFDFVSMVAYDLESKTNEQITAEVNLRASRFKALYPNTPLMIGEFGAKSCAQGQEDNQSRVNISTIQAAQTNKYGFNLWSFAPAAVNECSPPISGGLSVTNSDGSPKKSATTIAELLGGSISNMPITYPIGTQNPTPPSPTSPPVVNSTTPNEGSAITTTPPTNQGTNTGFPDSSLYRYPSSSLVNDSGTIYFITGHTKIPFTNWQAFSGLGYSARNVINGSLENYTASTTYSIDSANEPHPWGTWLTYNKTIYYSHETGLIGVPTQQTFLANGGIMRNVVKANKYDLVNLSNSIPVMEQSDSRIYR